MKAATLAGIKRELQHRDPEEIQQLCLRLGRFKKDNKELLTYLLFEAQDENGFAQSLKNEIDEMMETINLSNLYYTKKGLQKIVRFLNKNVRYSGIKNTEVDVRLYFCQVIKTSNIPIHRNKTINNLYHREIKRINNALSSLHEDIQADYQYELGKLELD
jgi:hypothetical protein